MDMQDFNHNQKYKLILPIIYVFNWLLMATGPILYPVAYQIYSLTFFTYMTVKTVFNLIWAIIGFTNGLKAMSKYQKKIGSTSTKNSYGARHNQLHQNDNIQYFIHRKTQMDIYHAFIIPSYRQESSLIEETLKKLAAHKEAKYKYLVYLAMEAHEEGSAQKAKALIKLFNLSFRQMGYSHHTIREFEQKGKASNVSWCAENLQKTYFKDLSIKLDQIFVTVIDADSWVPEMYIDEVNEHILSHQDEEYSFIYQPCQIFTRNHMEVPFLTRTYDQSHSLVHFCNLVSCFNASFPLSNYTLSFELIKRIGFWDTCADAIGQDFHTTIKAFWKTEGLVKTIYLHTPFNQVNIQTGQGYFNDMNARFWQAERHARGCADTAYCINMLVTKPINFRTFIISYNSIECFILPAVLPWLMIGSTLQNFIYSFQSQPMYLISSDYSNILFKVCTYSFLFSYLFYYILKRKATTEMYNLENEPFWRIIQFPLMILPNLFLVSFPTFTIAAFKVMLNRNEYVVAKKKLKHQR